MAVAAATAAAGATTDPVAARSPRVNTKAPGVASRPGPFAAPVLWRNPDVIPTDAPGADRDAILQKVEAALDEDVRPGLRADGSEVEVVGIDDDRIVQVRLTGACEGCGNTVVTLTFGIEAAVKERVPEVRFLEAVP